MGNLLRFETRKLLRQKKLYVCSIIIFLSVLLTAWVASVLLENSFADLIMFNITGVDGMLTAVSDCSFVLVSSIFAVLLITEDYDQMTIKNIYARGYSRTRVYLAKVSSAVLGMTMMFLFMAIFTFCLYTELFGAGDVDMAKALAVLGVQYLVCLANVMLAVTISTAIRKNGLAITTVIFLPTIANLVLELVQAIWELEKISLSDFWVSNLLYDLLVISVPNDRLIECCVTALIYIAVFGGLGLFSAKKVEL